MNREERLRVGVITMHKVINYGSFLQAYATQKVIEDMGHICDIIDYDFPNEWHYENGLNKRMTFKTQISNVLYPLGIKKNHRKKKKILQAVYNYLNLSERFRNPNDILNSTLEYDVYITGSDQTWNPKHTKGDSIFLLSFAPENTKKISFSASLAANNLDLNYKYVFSKWLRKYTAISIRDANGNDVIKELTGKNAKVTLDPTLMLSRTEWIEFGKKCKEKTINESYIIFYLIKHSFDPTPYIYEILKELQKDSNLKVVSFTKIPAKYGIKYSNCSDISVEGYIKLFENAAFVVTSSFHGTAFAVNFGIPLYSVVPSLNSPDDRQSSLLKRLKLNNCIVPIGKKFDKISPLYDVQKQQKHLEEMRMESRDFLLDTIRIN